MAQKIVKAVKASGGEAAAGKGNPESSAGKLADGVALIEGMLSGKSSQEDPEVAEVGAGAATEAAGSGSESSVQEGTEAVEAEGEGQGEEVSRGDAEGAEGEAETEQTEGEVEQVAEAEAGAEAEELTPGQEAVNKRIGELTAKRKQAEEERDALKAELEELRGAKEAETEGASGAGPSPSGWVSPIERIPQVREARTKVAQAAQTRELAEGLLAGEPEAALEAVRGAGVKVASAEKAIEYLQGLSKAAAKAEMIGESRLAAVEFNANQLVEQDRKVTTAQARATYPWLLNRKSVERQMFDEVVKLYPFVKEDPAFELVVGDMVTGAMARQVAAAKAAQAQGKNGAGNGKVSRGGAEGAEVNRVAVRPVALGKPKVGMGAGTLGKGRDGDSIRDQAMKDPTNEVARERYFERMVAGA